MEEASFLSKFGSKVIIVHRRDQFRASKAMQKRVLENEKIEVAWDSVLVSVSGTKLLEKVIIKNVKTGENREIEASGLFYAIGHTPNTAFLNGQVETDESGYIVVKPGTSHTSVEGVFAAGDVHDKKYRQAITAAGSGCQAALEVEHWLTEQE
eukprot:TRINITY_DN1094_c0_g1_i15.p1 TRINITY_DN1094_c0_g1~~TRINITY_DN1094_c0_g1_i15.p1  ORF type:complete len:153 (+),score=46.90 TRINITY_DN1094_c0_g1_i15:93-551(+)